MNILNDIVSHKREELLSRKKLISRASLGDGEYFRRATASLRDSLTSHIFGIIAELKRSSPSAGHLRAQIDAGEIALSYARNGASGISVLTDERYFSGTLEDLSEARAAVQIPLLRKDFIVDEYQIVEARAFGADAVLLIAAILDKSQLSELFQAARELNLESLVELYELREIDILDFDRMKLVGINSRDLRTFAVDSGRVRDIARHIPKDVTLVAESGISTSRDLAQLSASGIRAALIGEFFMKSPDPGSALARLLDDFSHETPR